MGNNTSISQGNLGMTYNVHMVQWASAVIFQTKINI